MSIIRIGTSERGGTFWTEGEAIASLVQRETGIESQILEASQASIENARRLDEGLIDLAFMASNWIGRASKGEIPFEHEIDVRVVAPANAGAMFFITRADNELLNVRDMVGKRVSIGPKGSGMVQHIHTIFGVLGISFDDFTPVYLSFEDGGKALEAGDVDAQWQCPYPNVVMRDISERTDVRVLEYHPDDLADLLRSVDFYRPAVMPKGFFKGVDADTQQAAVVNIIAAHARSDAETVHAFVTTMLNSLDELAEINPLFIGLGDVFDRLKSVGASSLEFGGTALHPGAIQAYRDAGYLS
jgi:TRAP transporter TAXI family solute receptor